MPELPEVETVRRDLARVLQGRRVTGFLVRKPNLLKSPRALFGRKFVGATIVKVGRRAKLLYLELSSGYTLLLHLKMTGQLVWARKARFTRHEINADARRRGLPRGERGGLYVVGGHPISGVLGVPNRFTYITVRLSDGAKLYFNDVRQFGYWRLVRSLALPEALAHFGPEPLSREFTLDLFRAQLARRRRTSIKAALLDQTVVAGIGNIYADESLFVAKLKPSRRVTKLTRAETQQLYHAIRRVLSTAVKARGTSFNSYVDGLGRSGTYWERRLVYGRKGEPCPRCKRPIQKTVVAGRGTHFCSRCQL